MCSLLLIALYTAIVASWSIVIDNYCDALLLTCHCPQLQSMASFFAPLLAVDSGFDGSFDWFINGLFNGLIYGSFDGLVDGSMLA